MNILKTFWNYPSLIQTMKEDFQTGDQMYYSNQLIRKPNGDVVFYHLGSIHSDELRGFRFTIINGRPAPPWLKE